MALIVLSCPGPLPWAPEAEPGQYGLEPPAADAAGSASANSESGARRARCGPRPCPVLEAVSVTETDGFRSAGWRPRRTAEPPRRRRSRNSSTATTLTVRVPCPIRPLAPGLGRAPPPAGSVRSAGGGPRRRRSGRGPGGEEHGLHEVVQLDELVRGEHPRTGRFSGDASGRCQSTSPRPASVMETSTRWSAGGAPWATRPAAARAKVRGRPGHAASPCAGAGVPISLGVSGPSTSSSTRQASHGGQVEVSGAGAGR